MVEIKGDEASRENGLSGEKSLSKENTAREETKRAKGNAAKQKEKNTTLNNP